MKRALNIGLRTAHLCAMGIVLGGFVFGVAPARLAVSLWVTVGTGLLLTGAEIGFRATWFHEGRGLMTIVKLLLLCALPLVHGARLPLLFAVVVIGSVGSHMPGRFRHYSVLRREILERGPARGSSGGGGKERRPGL
jgi:hypothetical protein